MGSAQQTPQAVGGEARRQRVSPTRSRHPLEQHQHWLAVPTRVAKMRGDVGAWSGRDPHLAVGGTAPTVPGSVPLAGGGGEGEPQAGHSPHPGEMAEVGWTRPAHRQDIPRILCAPHTYHPMYPLIPQT